MNSNKKKKKGFTLIELVIVLAVLAIIALIAIPNFNKVRVDSQKKADDSTCETIKDVAQMGITDEYFVTSGKAGGTITIKFVEKVAAVGGTPEIPAGIVITQQNVTWNGKTVVAVPPSTAVTQGQVNFETALKDVNAPQEKDKNAYVITIDANDSITKVQTSKIN